MRAETQIICCSNTAPHNLVYLNVRQKLFFLTEIMTECFERANFCFQIATLLWLALVIIICFGLFFEANPRNFISLIVTSFKCYKNFKGEIWKSKFPQK